MVGVVSVPEKTLKKLNERILPQWKICFLSALAVGIIAHLYKITNWLPNWDSLVFRYDSQNMLALGRWLLPVVCLPSSFYDLPFLNGIIAILFHALGAVCICKILNVKKKMTAFLIGAVIVSFPTVTSVMMYNYVADGYSVAFFLSALATVLMTKEKPRYILSAILIALSSGIYQAYITVTIVLVMLFLIDETIYKKETLVVILKKGLLIFLSGVLGVALYAIILKVLLCVSSSRLIDYQGISTAASFFGIDVWGSLYAIKKTFIKCFFDISKGLNLYIVINIFVFLFTLAHYVKYIIKNGIYKNPSKIFVLVIMGFMLVSGAGALAFMNPGLDYHNLMLMGYVVFYLFFLVLYERGKDTNEKHLLAKCWTVFIIALMIILNQVVISNVSYHKAQIAYEKSYGVLIRIADRIETTYKTESCDRVLVVGALRNSEPYSVNLTPDITGITDGYIIRADDETVGQSVLCSALNDYCGKNYKFISGERKKELLAKNSIASMESWPGKGCVLVEGNVVIVKLGAESE